ncbi:cilia- and flagella-associated protein 44 [Pelomyxa schiedti]|nr:cilia- and flagella-associated protein 44 [Pelomyxa schiedti]
MSTRQTAESPLFSLEHSFGYENNRRNNLHLAPTRDAEAVLYIAGCTVQELNLNTGEQRTLFHSERPNSALSVNILKNIMAVGEQGPYAAINIVNLSTTAILYVFSEEDSKNFCESESNTNPTGYHHLCFLSSGDKLASISFFWEYSLVIWDVERAYILLRSRFLSQPVLHLSFDNDMSLVSSGVNHLTFWRPANTFTGQKLQRESGKFGEFDLTDIFAFTELPDGKILSGTVLGKMLIWEGGTCVCDITKTNGKPCHYGNIESVKLAGDVIASAGADGFFKLWSSKQLSLVDTSSTPHFTLEPLSEVSFGDSAYISTILHSSHYWITLDNKSCTIHQIDVQGSKPLFHFQSGPLHGICLSPCLPLAATTGEDMTVRLFNYRTKIAYTVEKFDSQGTTLAWAPISVDPKGKTIAVGFSDGIVRLLSCGLHNLTTIYVVKPHVQKVTSISFSPCGQFLATCSDDGTIFFFLAQIPSCTPLGFTSIPSSITSLSWSQSGASIVLCTKSDGPFQLTLPSQLDVLDTATSYDINLPLSPVSLPYLEHSGRKDAFTKPTLSVCTDGGVILISVSGNASMTYLPDRRQIDIDMKVTCGSYASGKLVLGSSDGFISAWTIGSQFSCLWRSRFHSGAVTGLLLSFDEQFLLSIGEDGNIFSFRATKPHVGKEQDITEILGQNHCIPITAPLPSLTLQEEKKKEIQVRSQLAAERKRAEIASGISDLREKFASLLDRSKVLPYEYQLPTEIQTVDNQCLASGLDSEFEEEFSPVKQKLISTIANQDQTLQKLKSRYIDCLKVPKITVLSFESKLQVSTFVLHRMSAAMNHKLEVVHSETDSTNKARVKSAQKKTTSAHNHSLHGKPFKIPLPKKGTMMQSIADTRVRQENLRKQMWEKHNMSRPTPNPVEDIASIQHVKNEIGDFPLKILLEDSPAYSSEMLTVRYKRKEKLLLKEKIYQVKKKFNSQLISLRDKKANLLKQMNMWNNEIMQLNKSLGIFEALSSSELAQCEEPERVLVISNEETLASEQKTPTLRIDSVSKSAISPDKPTPISTLTGGFRHARHSTKRLLSVTNLLSIKGTDTLAPLRGSSKFSSSSISVGSELEELEQKITQIQSTYLKNELLEKIRIYSAAFDLELSALRKEKFHIASDVKFMELKLTLLKKEIYILKDFEKQACIRTNAIEAKKQERAQQLAQIEELRSKEKDELPQLLLGQKSIKHSDTHETSSPMELLYKKLDLIEVSLSEAENGMKNLQIDRKRKLNDLHTVVALGLHQIQTTHVNEMPGDFSSSIVFSQTQLDSLHKRIDDIQMDNQTLHLQTKLKNKELQALRQQKTTKEKQVKELENKSQDLQLRKFGQLIPNIELLDQLSESKTTDDLEKQIQQQENLWAANLVQLEVKLKEERQEYVRTVEMNTELLQKLHSISLEEYHLEELLGACSENKVKEASTAKRLAQLEAEAEKLNETIQLQQKELSTLDVQIQQEQQHS